jgi:hypothetical protein
MWTLPNWNSLMLYHVNVLKAPFESFSLQCFFSEPTRIIPAMKESIVLNQPIAVPRTVHAGGY